jgi:hypothetical protein
MTINLNPFNGIIGLPPSTHCSDTMIINSMPVMEILPAEPHFESGLNLFRLNDAWDTYKGILENHGYTLSQKPLKLAFIADNFPTDSFTNEYGETFLQSFTDVASSGMQQLVQMTGQRSGIEGGISMSKGIQEAGQAMGGIGGDIVSGLGSGAEGAFQMMQNIKNNLGNQSEFMKKSLAGLDQLVAGARVDFPQIWKNSGFTPSYTATVRLYNPNPGNIEATKQYIIGPLAAILCLAVPRSTDGTAYNWPFFHKIHSPGIYGLDPGVITNITVVKGGDQQQIAFSKRLAMLDVRIDITSLYGSMVLDEKNPNEHSNRPTVYKYLKSLEGSKNEASYFKRNEMNKRSGSSAGVFSQGPRTAISSNIDQGPFSREFIAKNEAARRMKAQKQIELVATSRVSPLLTSLSNNLRALSPEEFFT